MKSFLFFLVLLSFLSFVELNHARKEPRENYWKSMTKDQPIPGAIRDLFVQDPAAGADKMNHFVTDFDTKHNAIIYHSHEKDKLKEKKSMNPTNTWDHEKEKE
ncbi:hypothetical protein BDE02_09G100400 [Populus trichocarpa]|nr:hypothetical protein BDE02_09G100400 [Populus trichocarpa]